jgi:hypothetical protein
MPKTALLSLPKKAEHSINNLSISRVPYKSAVPLFKVHEFGGMPRAFFRVVPVHRISKKSNALATGTFRKRLSRKK